MTSFLKSFFIEEDIIGKISDCILATKVPSNQKRQIEKIIM